MGFCIPRQAPFHFLLLSAAAHEPTSFRGVCCGPRGRSSGGGQRALFHSSLIFPVRFGRQRVAARRLYERSPSFIPVRATGSL